MFGIVVVLVRLVLVLVWCVRLVVGTVVCRVLWFSGCESRGVVGGCLGVAIRVVWKGKVAYGGG